ncbi:MAG: hypothetical protein QM831_42525 [Kofleriaceae bacterium]
MSLELLFGSAVGASFLGIYVRMIARVRRRQQWEKTNERTIFRVFEQAAVANPYQVVPIDEAVPFVRQTVALADQLHTLGYRDLGSIITVFAVDHVLRGFVDAAGIHVAIIAANANGAVLQMTSFAADESFNTRRGDSAGLAYPPTSHRQIVDKDLGLADVIARHKAFLPSEPGLIRVESTTQLVELLVANRKRSIAWRKAQPPEELLDRDLRGLLGEDNYKRFGPWFTRRLREPLPMATLKKR